MLQVEEIPDLFLDLGGGPASFFASMFPKPKQIILADINHNLAWQAKQARPALQVIVADGERLPLLNSSIGGTVCNSVIEHVDRPELLATELRRVSRNYFLQTPNRDFPLETHSFIAIPFYNFIPWRWLQRSLCKIFGANFEYVNSVQYISEQKLRHLFPEAKIAYEKAFGLKKSFYVYYINSNT